MKRKYIIIIIVLLMLISFYLYYEDNYLKVSYYSIKDENLPSRFNGYKIAQISDYHNTKSLLIKNRLVNTLKEEKPDIIVITGDLVDRNRTNIEVSLNLIKEIANISPIYYVKGNHESVIKDYDKLKEGLIALGVTVLENDSVILKNDGDMVKLIGINDPTSSKDFGLKNNEIITKELEPFVKDDTYKILLSHRSEQLDTYSQNNINLVFTGHSHGGQVRLPFIGGLYAPHQGFLPKYTSGVHIKGNTHLVISRGIGNSTFPFRVNNRPELVIVNLSKGKEKYEK